MQTLTKILSLVALSAFAFPALAEKSKPVDPPIAKKTELLKAKRVVIDYLPQSSDKTQKTTLTLEERPAIKRLVKKMNFKKTKRCRCRHKYRLTFTLADERQVVVYSFSHGWRFDSDPVPQRKDPGSLINHIDRLFGIPKGRYYQ